MIGFILVGLVVGLIAIRYLVNADPAFLASVFKNSLLIVVAIIALFFFLTGRANFYVLPILLPIAISYIIQKYRKPDAAPQASQDSIKESYDILGLDEGASREEIIEAHRRLIKKNHPDKGGSPYLAKKLNEAKDILLNSKG